MRPGYTLFLLLAVSAACSRDDSESGTKETLDSTKRISTHTDLEKKIWEYYLSIEEDVKLDLGVSEAEIIGRVQALIDEGYVKEPLILVITEDGPLWEAVDYSTYKEYMTSNILISRRFHGTQPNVLDRVFMDSIRSGLLDALKRDSVH